jgi:hypothetical protein
MITPYVHVYATRIMYFTVMYLGRIDIEPPVFVVAVPEIGERTTSPDLTALNATSPGEPVVRPTVPVILEEG